MNFRASTDPKTGAHHLAFGEGSKVLFDNLGAITALTVHVLDRGFHHTARRIARDAASDVRTAMARPHFGTAASQTRLQFITRVAARANEIEATSCNR